MDKIISRIAEIDAEAVKIMDEAAARKKEIDAEMKSAASDYDRQLEADTQNKIKVLRDRMAHERHVEVKKLYEKMEQDLQSLDHKYETEHEKISNHLLKILINS